MTPELKARWLKALRSGRYHQVTSYLQTADGKNCCLGVLCRIVAPRDWEKGCGDYLSHALAPNGNRLSLAGLDCVGLTTKQQNRLIFLNDDACRSFPEIADWIEKSIKAEAPK